MLSVLAALVMLQSSPADSLRAQIERRIQDVPGAIVGVSLRDLGSGDSLDINADESFHAASTMKVPVMIELFRQAERGWVSLDQPVMLVNQFGSIVDASPFSVDAGDDSDSLLYNRVGQRVPVRELMNRMITRSSNLATNALIALIGPERANATAHELGANNIQVLRGVEDQKAIDAGRNNPTTANSVIQPRFFNDTTTTEIYTFPYTTLFRSGLLEPLFGDLGRLVVVLVHDPLIKSGLRLNRRPVAQQRVEKS